MGGRAVSVLQWMQTQSRMQEHRTVHTRWHNKRMSMANVRSYIFTWWSLASLWWVIYRITQPGFVVTYYWNIFMKTSMMDMSNIGRQTSVQLVTLNGRVFTFGDFNAATRNDDDISSDPFLLAEHSG